MIQVLIQSTLKLALSLAMFRSCYCFFDSEFGTLIHEIESDIESLDYNLPVAGSGSEWEGALNNVTPIGTPEFKDLSCGTYIRLFALSTHTFQE